MEEAATFLAPAWGLLRGEAAGPTEDIALHFTPRAGQWVRDVRWHLSQRTKVLDDGKLEMSFHCGVTPELVRWVLSYGSDVQVLRPMHLRQAVIDEARRVVSDSEAY